MFMAYGKQVNLNFCCKTLTDISVISCNLKKKEAKNS